jgi:hypothetical protein
LPCGRFQLDLFARTEHKRCVAAFDSSMRGTPPNPAMSSRAARLRAAALVWIVALLWAPLGFAQDPFGGDMGGPPGGNFGPQSKPKSKQKANPDQPETHAASGAGDHVIPPGGEPTLPEDPLALPDAVAKSIGSDAALDEPPTTKDDSLKRRFYGVMYEESGQSGYPFPHELPRPSGSNGCSRV